MSEYEEFDEHEEFDEQESEGCEFEESGTLGEFMFWFLSTGLCHARDSDSIGLALDDESLRQICKVAAVALRPKSDLFNHLGISLICARRS